MCKAVEELAESWAVRRVEESILDTRIDDIKNLMETMKLSVEQAMDALRISEADKAVLLKRF